MLFYFIKFLFGISNLESWKKKKRKAILLFAYIAGVSCLTNCPFYMQTLSVSQRLFSWEEIQNQEIWLDIFGSPYLLQWNCTEVGLWCQNVRKIEHIAIFFLLKCLLKHPKILSMIGQCYIISLLTVEYDIIIPC